MDFLISKYKAQTYNSNKRVYLDNFSHNTTILLNVYIAYILNHFHTADIYFIDDPEKFACSVYRKLNFIPIPYSFFNSRTFKSRYLLHYFRDKVLGKFKGKRLTDVKISKLFIGDLLADTVLRFDTKGKFDADLFCSNYSGTIKNAYFHYHVSLYLLTRWKITDGIMSHPDYINFGILPRLGIQFNCKFMTFLKGGLFKVQQPDDIYFSKYHATPQIWQWLNAIPDARIQHYLNSRYNAQETLFDADYAYRSNKRQLSRNEFIHELGLNPDLPICTIYLHAFADANHYEQKMIYNSYYHWLLATIQIIQNIKTVNWLVKDHPQCYMYDEEGVVPTLLQQYKLKYVPADINNKSVLQISDAIVTVRGTVGLEAINFDALPILTGYSYYSSYGFTCNCTTEHEYITALRNVNFKVPIPIATKLLAGRILYWTSELIAAQSNIINYAYHPNNQQEAVAYFNKYCTDIEAMGGIENDPLFNSLRIFISQNKASLTGLGPC